MKYLKNKCIIKIVVFIVLGPILIHFAYKIQSPFWISSVWTAGDALSYFGVIVGSIITIIGLHLTFHDNRIGLIEQNRLENLPFLALNILSVKRRNSWTDSAYEKSNSNNSDYIKDYFFKEEKLDSILFIIKNHDIIIKSEFTEDEKRNIIYDGYRWADLAKGVMALTKNKLLYIPIQITNVGNGAAIDLKIGLNYLSEKESDSSEYLYVRPINLPVNDSIFVVIYSNNLTEDNNGKFLLELKYEDMYKNRYL